MAVVNNWTFLDHIGEKSTRFCFINKMPANLFSTNNGDKARTTASPTAITIIFGSRI
jgi:hypothetical protein